MTTKLPVSGDSIQPVFSWLTNEANKDHDGPVRWNFEKFLINKEGQLVDRWRSFSKPESKSIVKVLEKTL